MANHTQAHDFAPGDFYSIAYTPMHISKGLTTSALSAPCHCVATEDWETSDVCCQRADQTRGPLDIHPDLLLTDAPQPLVFGEHHNDFTIPASTLGTGFFENAELIVSSDEAWKLPGYSTTPSDASRALPFTQDGLSNPEFEIHADSEPVKLPTSRSITLRNMTDITQIWQEIQIDQEPPGQGKKAKNSKRAAKKLAKFLLLEEKDNLYQSQHDHTDALESLIGRITQACANATQATHFSLFSRVYACTGKTGTRIRMEITKLQLDPKESTDMMSEYEVDSFVTRLNTHLQTAVSSSLPLPTLHRKVPRSNGLERKARFSDDESGRVNKRANDQASKARRTQHRKQLEAKSSELETYFGRWQIYLVRATSLSIKDMDTVAACTVGVTDGTTGEYRFFPPKPTQESREETCDLGGGKDVELDI